MHPRDRNATVAAACVVALLSVLLLGVVSAPWPRAVPAPAGTLRVAAGPTIQGEYPGNGQTIGSSTPTIQVLYTSALPVVFVAFHLDGMNLTNAGTFSQSAFVLPLALELRDGPHVANFTAVDALGGPAFDNWTFTVDTVPPILLVTSPAYPMVPASAIFVNGTAVLASPLFAGAAPINVTVTVLPSHLVRWTFPAADGSFSVLVVLSEGLNTIFVNATDAVGNLAYDIKSVVRDTVEPPLVVLSPANMTVSSTSVVRFAGLSEFGVYLYVNGVNVAVAPNGTWSVDLALPDGIRVVPITATDLVGNTNVTVLVVMVDSDTPQVTLTSPLVPITNRSSVVVSGYATDSRLVAVLVNNISVPFDPTTGAFTKTLTLPDGLVPVVVVAVDAALHRAIVVTGVLVDTAPPTVRIRDPLDGLETNQSTVVVDGTVDDANATVLVNDQEVRPDSDGTWRTTVALLVGVNTLRVSAVDEAGNHAALVLRSVTYYAPWPGLDRTIQDNQNAVSAWAGWIGLGLVAVLLVILVVVLAMYVRFNARVLKLRPPGGMRAAEDAETVPVAAPKEAEHPPSAKPPT